MDFLQMFIGVVLGIIIIALGSISINNYRLLSSEDKNNKRNKENLYFTIAGLILGILMTMWNLYDGYKEVSSGALKQQLAAAKMQKLQSQMAKMQQ